MKKVLLTTLLLTGSAAVAGSPLTGLHLGVQGGLQRTSFDQKLNTTDRGNDDDANTKVGKVGHRLAGDVSLGYFDDCGSVHWGVKLVVGSTFGNREKNATDGLDAAVYEGVKTKVSQKETLAVIGQLGGYVGKDSVLYALAGVKRARYELDLSANSVGAPDKFRENVGKNLVGPVFGAGFKMALSDKWIFNTEVSYEMYPKMGTGDIDSVNADQNLGMTIKPRVWNLNFGLSYKF